MKKRIVCAFILGLSAVVAGCAAQNEEKQADGNYSDEMKIEYTCNLDEEYGADSVEREGDHESSPYFNTLDFYNMESNDTLTILTGFKTQQQTSEWSCGVSSSLMVLNWFDKLGDYNEESLAAYRSNGLEEEATSMSQMVEIFEGVGGFDVYSRLDVEDDAVHETFTLDYIQETLKEGVPIIVGWNDWGGHWETIIGYDTMGTETTQDDVLIFADSYDTTDHNQDGYGVYSAERFLYNFTFYNLFSEESGEPNDYCFLVARPTE